MCGGDMMNTAREQKSEPSLGGGVLRLTLAAASVGIAVCLLAAVLGFYYAERFTSDGLTVRGAEDLRGFLELCYSELRFFALVFFASFTLYAPIVGAAVLALKSSAFGGALFMLVSAYGDGPGSCGLQLVSFAVSAAALLLLYAAALAAVVHSRSLRYAVPDVRVIAGYPETRGFVRAFAVLAAAVIVLLVMRTAAFAMLA